MPRAGATTDAAARLVDGLSRGPRGGSAHEAYLTVGVVRAQLARTARTAERPGTAVEPGQPFATRRRVRLEGRAGEAATVPPHRLSLSITSEIDVEGRADPAGALAGAVQALVVVAARRGTIEGVAVEVTPEVEQRSSLGGARNDRLWLELRRQVDVTLRMPRAGLARSADRRRFAPARVVAAAFVGVLPVAVAVDALDTARLDLGWIVLRARSTRGWLLAAGVVATTFVRVLPVAVAVDAAHAAGRRRRGVSRSVGRPIPGAMGGRT
jgi:hypothetical protein